jgi:hypothetical protein
MKRLREMISFFMKDFKIGAFHCVRIQAAASISGSSLSDATRSAGQQKHDMPKLAGRDTDLLQ